MNPHNHNKAHTSLTDEILYAVGRLPDVRIWRRNVGLATPWKAKDPIYYGIKGETDLDGIIYPNGQRLGIEVKTGRGKLEEDQIRWRAMILKFGGAYIQARSLEQVMEELERYRHGKSP